MVTIHDDQPFSLVGAFEDPVSPKNGHLRTATEKLLEHDRQLADAYGCQAVDRQILAVGLARDVVEKAGLTLSPIDALVRCAEDAVRTLPEA